MQGYETGSYIHGNSRPSVMMHRNSFWVFRSYEVFRYKKSNLRLFVGNERGAGYGIVFDMFLWRDGDYWISSGISY